MLTVHMEHELPLMANLDLGLILEAQERLAKNDPSAIADVMRALGKAGGMLVIRKLSAVVNASAEELLESERNPKTLEAMETAAALKPFGETFGDAIRFFTEWAASLGAPLASSGSQMGATKADAAAGASRSEDS